MKTVAFVMMLAVLPPTPAAAQAQQGANSNTYDAKGCAQIGDSLVCGAAEIAAAVAAALAAARIAAEKARVKPKRCFCVCGSGSDAKPLEHMHEYECRATCAMDYHFTYGDYSCK